MSARAFTAEQEVEIVRRYEAGDSVATIGKTEGCSPTTINKILRRYGVELRTANPVVTEAQRQRIVDLYTNSGMTIDQTAEVVGVSPRFVDNWLKKNGISFGKGRR